MPPRTSFESIDCSIARTMAVLGEPWTAMILRDLFIGITRFDPLYEHLSVSRKVLTRRLHRLVAEGIVVRRPYLGRPERFDYLLTDKGWELCDVLLAVTAWGDRYSLRGKAAGLRLGGLVRLRRSWHLVSVHRVPLRLDCGLLDGRG